MTLGGIQGTIRDTALDIRSANIVCHKLGYQQGAADILTSSSYGKGNGPVWLYSTACSGTESSILDCPGLEWGDLSSSHDFDASVICAQRKVNGEIALVFVLSYVIVYR